MNPPRSSASSSLLALLRTLAAAGTVTFLAGLYFAPQRAWVAFLVAFVLFTGLAAMGPFTLALLTLSRARWAGPLRRVPEAMGSGLPFAVLLGLVLLAGTHSLYEWSHTGAVEGDALLAHKAPYLNLLGFALRMALYFAAWILLSRRLRSALRAEQSEPSVEASRRSIRAAATFLAVFAVTFSLACVDWLESLEPHWFSTIYALVPLSTLALAALAVVVLLAAHVQRVQPSQRLLPPERATDLGRLAIGLSLFWAYIGYCQQMLIWYTNMPEETAWYAERARGDWPVVARVCIALCWLVPFLTLMPLRLRRDVVTLVRVSAAVLVGVVLHLYYLVAPALHGSHTSLGLLEVLVPLGALSGFGWVALRELERGAAEAHTLARERGSADSISALRAS